MPRPSRNLDQSLLEAGRQLFPDRGCAGLAVREVAELAGVNLGMFHYHFKSREAFLRAVMQQGYEAMFSRLTLETARAAGPHERLRFAMRTISRFVRDNRRFIARLLADALSGEACARDFMRDNMPRHLEVLRSAIAQGQREGLFTLVPLPQAMGVCAGSMGFPILVGGALADSGMLEPATAAMIEKVVLSNDALDERIELAIRAISQPRQGVAAGAPAKRGTRGKR